MKIYALNLLILLLRSSEIDLSFLESSVTSFIIEPISCVDDEICSVDAEISCATDDTDSTLERTVSLASIVLFIDSKVLVIYGGMFSIEFSILLNEFIASSARVI